MDITKTVFFNQAMGGPPTLDLEAVDKAGRERRAAEEARKPKQAEPEYDWRGELDELEKRLRGYSPEADCIVHAATQEAKHKTAVGAIEDEIAYVQSLLSTPGLDICIPRQQGREPKGGCSCDMCVFDKRIRVLGSRLAEAKRKQQVSIRECGDLINRAKALKPLVPRYRELAAKAKKIATARKVARGLVDGGSHGMHEESIQGNERLFQSQHPALTWETKAGR